MKRFWKTLGLGLAAVLLYGWEVLLLGWLASVLMGGDDYWLPIFIGICVVLLIVIFVFAYLYSDPDLEQATEAQVLASKSSRKSKSFWDSFWRIPTNRRYTSGGIGWKLRKQNPEDWRHGREGELFKRTGRRRKF